LFGLCRPAIVGAVAEHWIEARDAIELAGSKFALCDRLLAGLVKSRARLFIRDETQSEDAFVPEKFWWAGGHEALEQDWETGDFSTWIDQKVHLQGFGIRFGLTGILDMLPVERRAIVARSLSVAGDAIGSAQRKLEGSHTRRLALTQVSRASRLSNRRDSGSLPLAR